VTDEADEGYVHTIAVCPVSPELAGQVLGLADAVAGNTDGVKRVYSAIEAVGWSDEDLVPDVDASFRTGAGHMVYVEDRLTIPFMYEYWLGTELTPVDFWGDVPGWTARREPGSTFFDARIELTVQVFAERLGPPPLDVRTDDRARRRAVAWRVGTHGAALLVVGHSTDGFSYHQNDLAAVCLLPRPPQEPLPTAQALVETIAW
jgi:hypothetical protein